MPKSRSSTVTNNAKNLQVCGHKKCQKRAGPQSRKNKNMQRSAVMHKCLKLACPLSRNDIKNAKTDKSMVMEKCQKLSGPRSQKNTKIA